MNAFKATNFIYVHIILGKARCAFCRGRREGLRERYSRAAGLPGSEAGSSQGWAKQRVVSVCDAVVARPWLGMFLGRSPESGNVGQEKEEACVNLDHVLNSHAQWHSHLVSHAVLLAIASQYFMVGTFLSSSVALHC